MSKFRVINRPDVAPFKCANCLSAKEGDRQYVDFGAYVDWYGEILLCTFCLNEIGLHSGLFKAYELQILKLEEELHKSKTSAISSETLKETVLHTFKEVKEYFDSLPASGTKSVTGRDSGVDSESSSENFTESDSAAQGTKSEPVKPATKSGSKNVPSLADLLDSK
jgi:hypothetical protein